MNRHVIPSMFLSVLIVCSFGVLLFERDPDASGRKTDWSPVAKKNSEEGAPISASPTKDAATRPATSTIPDKHATRQVAEPSTEQIRERPVSKAPKSIAAPAAPAAPASVQDRPR